MKIHSLVLLLSLFGAPVLPLSAQPVWLNGPANPVTNTVTFPPGWALIANPLFHYRGVIVANAAPDNSVSALFPRMPNGTVLLKFDNVTQRFSRKNVFRRGRWSNPRATLAPGEGAFLFNPTRRSVAVTFTGNLQWGASVSVPAGLSLISSPGPGTIDFTPVVPPQSPTGPFAGAGIRFDPQPGDVVYIFDNATGRFQSHTFRNGAWDMLPVVGSGEAAFIYTTQPRVIQYVGPMPL